MTYKVTNLERVSGIFMNKEFKKNLLDELRY